MSCIACVQTRTFYPLCAALSLFSYMDPTTASLAPAKASGCTRQAKYPNEIDVTFLLRLRPRYRREHTFVKNLTISSPLVARRFQNNNKTVSKPALFCSGATGYMRPRTHDALSFP